MKIDVEQFLALAVAMGAVGAIGVAAYSSQVDLDQIAITMPEELDLSEHEASAAEELAAAMMASPVAAEPTDLDEAAGIPPVVPEPESNGYYAPGPDTETGNW